MSKRKYKVGQVVMVKSKSSGDSYPVKLRKTTRIGTPERGAAWMDTLDNIEYENEMRPLTEREKEAAMSENADWQPIETAPEGKVVMTKIDDERGMRNEKQLIRRGRLWFFPDKSMYVYYAPTHWRQP
jgi:hypothetical protein